MKKSLKKYLFFFLALCVFIVNSAVVMAQGPFSDVAANNTNLEAILYTQDMHIIDGYPDGSFKPNGNINRAELMKIVVEMTVGTPDSSLYKNCFPDVRTDWYAPYVCLAEENRWIDGYPDGTFKPANNVNRAEALKIILNAATNSNLNKDFGQAILNATYISDVDQNAWYYPFIEYAAAGRLLDLQHATYHSNGFSYRYYPAANMSRKEVVETIFRYRTMENNGLAQYNEQYGPYGYSMDYGIRSGLATEHEKSPEEIYIEITDAQSGYTKGLVNLGMEGDGGIFYAKVYEGGWVIVWDGNGIVECSLLEDFPEFMTEGCFEE